MTEPVADRETCANLLAKCEELGIAKPPHDIGDWMWGPRIIIGATVTEWWLFRRKKHTEDASRIPAFTTGALLVWFTLDGFVVTVIATAGGYDVRLLGGECCSNVNPAEALAQLALATMDKWTEHTE